MLSASHVGVVAAVIVLLFGTKRLPELGSGLGKAITNFKNAFKESSDEKPASDSQKGGAISNGGEPK